MPLLGILEINEQIFIQMDNSAVLLRDVKYSEEAMAFLVAYYYILKLKCPPTLKFVFGFFERLFEIERTFLCLLMGRSYMGFYFTTKIKLPCMKYV